MTCDGLCQQLDVYSFQRSLRLTEGTESQVWRNNVLRFDSNSVENMLMLAFPEARCYLSTELPTIWIDRLTDGSMDLSPSRIYIYETFADTEFNIYSPRLLLQSIGELRPQSGLRVFVAGRNLHYTPAEKIGKIILDRVAWTKLPRWLAYTIGFR